MRVAFLAAVLSLSVAVAPGTAQDTSTLADIRQELSVLYVEIQKLKRELSTTGAPAVQTGGTSMQDRVNAIEAALQSLTSRTEQLEFRIDQIVRDGTNRIGDLEFRLVELEGGDVGQLGETTTLGGVAGAENTTAVPVAPPPPANGQTELAIGEQADFDAAQAMLAEGNSRGAADAFDRFLMAYPGSPLAAEAHLSRGLAFAELGDTRESARAYLAGFSADPTGPAAPLALVKLGSALGALGQVDQACLTLAEVPVRFPMADAVSEAQAARQSLGCT